VRTDVNGIVANVIISCSVQAWPVDVAARSSRAPTIEWPEEP
jgi:hypothetical protein